MSTATRDRFARLVRRPDADLAEVALLACAEVEPDLDVEVELLRLDALADQLHASGFRPGPPLDNARVLASYLGGDLGFEGDRIDYHDPSNGLLTRVLDRRRGLPITLAIVYVAIARRVGVRAYGVNTPGHFLVGVGGARRWGAGQPAAVAREVTTPVVLDAFAGGELIGVDEVGARVREATSGLAELEPGMLHPAPVPTVARRLLNNLTRDFLRVGDIEDALWTVELKRLLPDSGAVDARALGEMLIQIGRYRRAAEVLERFLDTAPPGEQTEELTAIAMRARAKMN